MIPVVEERVRCGSCRNYKNFNGVYYKDKHTKISMILIQKASLFYIIRPSVEILIGDHDRWPSEFVSLFCTCSIEIAHRLNERVIHKERVVGYWRPDIDA